MRRQATETAEAFTLREPGEADGVFGSKNDPLELDASLF
jgi:hypothetical protein